MVEASVKTAVRVISIKGSPRRATFIPPPASIALDWSFMDASTTLIAGLDVDEKRVQLINNRQLVPGEIGCFASHVAAWREFLADPSLDQLIVVEDDVFVDWTILDTVAKHDWRGSNVDYLKLYAKGAPPFRVLHMFYPVPGFYTVQYMGLALGTQAYLLTREGAARLERKLSSVSRPVDQAMDRPWYTGVPVVGLMPYPAIELAGASTITQREVGPRRRSLSYLQGRLIEHTRMKMYRWFGRSVGVR